MRNFNFVDGLANFGELKRTENGATAYSTTKSKVYDLFALGGAYRKRQDKEVAKLFIDAFEEDSELALKVLFYLGDIRGGQGERRFFRVAFRELCLIAPQEALKVFKLIPLYRRWDDVLYATEGTEIEKDAFEFVGHSIMEDLQEIQNGGSLITLVGKWAPSENASSPRTKQLAKKLRRVMGKSSKEYRQILSKLRKALKVLERTMSDQDWDAIEFDKIPSLAGLKYRNCFLRREETGERYRDFFNRPKEQIKVNAGAAAPYNIAEKIFEVRPNIVTQDERNVFQAYWDNLTDYLDGKSSDMLLMIDTSASMWGMPMNVAISLGVYAAERMKGRFANKFLTFSTNPSLVDIDPKDDTYQKMWEIRNNSIVADTNLEKAFHLVLTIARANKLPQSELPKRIVVISDMEVNEGVEGVREIDQITSLMDSIRARFIRAGYEMPSLVYWNVDARHDTILDRGESVSLVSGFSPVIFEMIASGKNGYDLMLHKILSERYAPITLK